MLLDKYEPLFFNSNFREAASEAGVEAYRGEITVKEGEIADDQGRRRPPVELMRQAALLCKDDSLLFVTGSLDELQYMPAFLDKFAADLTPDTLAVMFCVNIDNEFTLDVNGAKLYFVPFVQGMTWNELIDMAALEKSDFKGQSAADKVVTVYEALKTCKFKYPESTLEAELGRTNSAKRENHGAI